MTRARRIHYVRMAYEFGQHQEKKMIVLEKNIVNLQEKMVVSVRKMATFPENRSAIRSIE